MNDFNLSEPQFLHLKNETQRLALRVHDPRAPVFSTCLKTQGFGPQELSGASRVATGELSSFWFNSLIRSLYARCHCAASWGTRDIPVQISFRSRSLDQMRDCGAGGGRGGVATSLTRPCPHRRGGENPSPEVLKLSRGTFPRYGARLSEIVA